MRSTYIKVRTEFEGFHFYPNAGDIDPRIKFLETSHRHMFKVEVKISVDHLDRELEFFLVKWGLESFIEFSDVDYMSCEMIGDKILTEHLIPIYGDKRHYEIVVSEDGESDGIIEWTPSQMEV